MNIKKKDLGKMTFGKFKGRDIRKLCEDEPEYMGWLVSEELVDLPFALGMSVLRAFEDEQDERESRRADACEAYSEISW